MQIRNGSPQGLRLDIQTVYFWWGEDADNDGIDAVATERGRVRLFSSEAKCRTYADAAEWHGRDDETGVIDAGPVQDWLGYRRSDLDPASALNLLNVAIDFAVSTGVSWDPRWGHSKNVYTKLLAFNVPYPFDPRSYQSRWATRETVILRAVLGDSIGLLRRSIG